MTSIAFSPAAERNQQHILEVLRRVLPEHSNVLEIASGTGQHALCFAGAMPQWTWQPSDFEAGALASIDARRAEAGLVNVLPAVQLDVLASAWPHPAQAFGRRFDAIFCANMIHIAPWPACIGLLYGSARYLAQDGLLITYGPYLEDEVATSPGNLAFDQSLRGRDPAWGIRRREDVEHEARNAGLYLRARHAMPADNLLLVLGR